MSSRTHRYGNILVLLVVVLAQMVLLGYQVKSNRDVRLIRVWAVTGVTPVAKVIESVRTGVVGFAGDYISLRDMREENRHIQEELDKLKLEAQFLRNELSTAERVQALAAFQQSSPSRTLASRVIGTAAGVGSKVVFVDRGTPSGVTKGMAVITADGIVGKVIAAFPTASQVQLITDSGFAAGVVSRKGRVRAMVKGQGHTTCRIDYVQNEEKIVPGEWFYTSGDDRVFPKGLPVGRVISARPGNPFQDITLEPSGLRRGLEEVLIVIEGVHQEVPDLTAASPEVHLLPPPRQTSSVEGADPSRVDPPQVDPAQPVVPAPSVGTDADSLREHYQRLGTAQGHTFGAGGPGAKPPDFNLRLPPGGMAQTPQAPPPSAQRSSPPPSKPAPPKVTGDDVSDPDLTP
ncbi:MAG: rod shape-determining protein MreC [Bryobacteraceae bacterium]